MYAEQKWTVLFVTHSVAEAVFLSTRIVILAPHPGRMAHEMAVDLPWPRTAETRESQAFEEAGDAGSRLLRGVHAGMKRQGMVAMNSVAVLACLLALWQAVIWLNHLPAYILPGPLAVAMRCTTAFRRCWIRCASRRKKRRAGLLASIVVGVAVAMVFAQWRWLRQTALSLHDPAADGADCGHCAADH